LSESIDRPNSDCACASGPGSPGDYVGELFNASCRDQMTFEDCAGQCVYEWDGNQWVQIINTCGG
jgi:hypothetical protein